MPDTDPRPTLFRCFDQAATIIGGVPIGQHDLPTPCSEFDVAALLAHIVGVGNRIGSIGRGEPQIGALHTPTDVGADQWASAFDDSAGRARAAWADDSVLDRKVELPFGTFDGATVGSIYILELTAHAWDLARATGQVDKLDDELAVAALATAHMMLPTEHRDGLLPFADVVPVDAGASTYDRLAGFLGRAVS